MVYKNGFFQLISKNNETYLRMFPPCNGGADIDPVEVSEYLESENIYDYDINVLNKVIPSEGMDSVDFLLNREPLLPAEEKMVVDISDDCLTAVARFYPPSFGGSLLSTESIIRSLNQNQVTYGIDELTIRKFLHKRQYCCSYTVARGTPPRHGEDARIDFHFDTDRKAKPKLLEDGSVDFHHLDAINHVEKDQCIATLIEADLGEAGTDVLGRTLSPRNVKRLFLKYGKNIYESEDKTQIFSSINGHVHLEGDKVFVSDTYEVLGDVDASTGDIEYEGNVDIKGNVRTGFIVRAGGDVNVKGVVEGAEIYSDGKVVIQRGIQGMNKGRVECKDSLYAKFIENSVVKTGGGVIAEAIMHSEVFAKDKVVVDGKKGLITGGQVASRSAIELKIGGSDMGTITRLEVGADPVIVEKCHLLAKRMPEIQREIDTNQKVVDMYSKKLAKGEKLGTEKLNSLKEAKIAVENATNEFHENQLLLEQYQEQIMANSSGVIQVENMLYPGVEVSIADVTKHIRKETKYCRLVRSGADIKIDPF